MNEKVISCKECKFLRLNKGGGKGFPYKCSEKHNEGALVKLDWGCYHGRLKDGRKK